MDPKVAAATDPAHAAPLAAALRLDPVTARVVPGSPLAATPMANLRAPTVATLSKEGLDAGTAEDAVARSWDPPDPVALAHGPRRRGRSRRRRLVQGRHAGELEPVADLVVGSIPELVPA